MAKELTIFESDKGLVTKFSEGWKVENNDNIDFSDHPVYWKLIWQLADSMQISDGSKIFKVGGAHWSFPNIKYWTKWKIRIIFTPEEENSSENSSKKFV